MSWMESALDIVKGCIEHLRSLNEFLVAENLLPGLAEAAGIERTIRANLETDGNDVSFFRHHILSLSCSWFMSQTRNSV